MALEKKIKYLKGLQKGSDKDSYPLLSLQGTYIFPHMIIPVFVHDPVLIQKFISELVSNSFIFVASLNNSNNPVTKKKGSKKIYSFHKIGTLCEVLKIKKIHDNKLKLLLKGITRAEFLEMVEEKKASSKVIIKEFDPQLPKKIPLKIASNLKFLKNNLEILASFGKTLTFDMAKVLSSIKDIHKLLDLVAANLNLSEGQSREVLEAINPVDRMMLVSNFLTKQIDTERAEQKERHQIREDLFSMNKAISGFLNNSSGNNSFEDTLSKDEASKNGFQKADSSKNDPDDSKDPNSNQKKSFKPEMNRRENKEELDDLYQLLESRDLPQLIQKEAEKQIRRLEKMHQDSTDANITRSYVENLLALPWNVFTKDDASISFVKKVLNEDHAGLRHIKERILEFLAVKKLNPNAKGPILCFVGPPGVGKTSLGKTIAAALGRSFARISLGGIHDEAEIRGHRRTYVGAMPGKILQAFKTAKTQNPLIMLDEIDKLGNQSFKGDPSSALLEVLDPEQNSTFMDHYLGLGFDLSKAIFVANANSIDQIPHALRDRLEVIEISGYSSEEKLEIAKKHVLPKLLKETGLSAQNIKISDKAFLFIIDNYTKESGLRQLERRLSSICRKIAVIVAESESKKFTMIINSNKITKFLGPLPIRNNPTLLKDQVGISYAMAYTQSGGDVLVIESALIKGKGDLILTGHLGEILKESAQLAFDCIKSFSKHLNISDEKLEIWDIHLHMPSGAIPKDGPSAGVAIALSLLSTLLNKPLQVHGCITGEITLHGNILPIGGVREKILSGIRHGFDTIFLPKDNKLEGELLALATKAKLNVIYMDHLKDLFSIVFQDSLTK